MTNNLAAKLLAGSFASFVLGMALVVMSTAGLIPFFLGDVVGAYLIVAGLPWIVVFLGGSANRG